MKVGDKEFHELREQFEKDLKHMPVYGHRVDRADRNTKVPAGTFYNDGLINQT